jgi:exodeoxyribonuclease V alpha subunit
MSLFDALFRAGALRTLDHAFAQSLRRLDLRDTRAPTDDLVLAGAALASLAVARGHAAFDPARPQLLLDAAIDGEWPDADRWRTTLAASRWVATASVVDTIAIDNGNTPLVLESGLLYLRRYREYERRLAGGLQRIAARVPARSDTKALSPLFAVLFPMAREGDLQARAAALALRRSLMLVTGGPGTGKTTTITRLLVLLLAQARQAGAPAPRIALAAPTGRAAERMADSLRHATAGLRDMPGVDAALCDSLPTTASTLHRLLGTLPGSPRFQHNADHPLPHDVIVVDEASMVDLPLMCKLVEAVPEGARLVLLGDPDQLPSVEAGDVLASITQAAGDGDAVPGEVADALRPLVGALPVTTTAGVSPLARISHPPPAAAADPSTVARPAPSADLDVVSATPSVAFSPPSAPQRRLDGLATEWCEKSGLAGHRVQLQRGYRQSDALRLAPLADAVRGGDADAALALLRDASLAGVRFHEDVTDVLAGPAREDLLRHWRSLGDGADPAEALRRAGATRLLTALRDGPQGAGPLNARIEEALAGARRDRYFHGRLLLVTENSYRHRLFNGDIGICLHDANATAVAWFAGGGEGVRAFHPAALPAHVGAFAMTVHKAQGSEFDSVWLQLPRQDARALSRELLYTAITRARSALHVCGSQAVLRAALSRHAVRVSGLAARLSMPIAG